MRVFWQVSCWMLARVRTPSRMCMRAYTRVHAHAHRLRCSAVRWQRFLTTAVSKAVALHFLKFIALLSVICKFIFIYSTTWKSQWPVAVERKTLCVRNEFFWLRVESSVMLLHSIETLNSAKGRDFITDFVIVGLSRKNHLHGFKVLLFV